MGERRQFPRVPEAFRLQYRMDGELASWVTVETRDLSASGLRFRTEAAMPLRAILRLRIELPGFREPVELKGHVVWSEMKSNGSSEHGVELVDVTERQRLAIDTLVGFLKRKIA